MRGELRVELEVRSGWLFLTLLCCRVRLLACSAWQDLCERIKEEVANDVG